MLMRLSYVSLKSTLSVFVRRILKNNCEACTTSNIRCMCHVCMNLLYSFVLFMGSAYYVPLLSQGRGRTFFLK